MDGLVAYFCLSFLSVWLISALILTYRFSFACCPVKSTFLCKELAAVSDLGCQRCTLGSPWLLPDSCKTVMKSVPLNSYILVWPKMAAAIIIFQTSGGSGDNLLTGPNWLPLSGSSLFRGSWSQHIRDKVRPVTTDPLPQCLSQTSQQRGEKNSGHLSEIFVTMVFQSLKAWLGDWAWSQ